MRCTIGADHIVTYSTYTVPTGPYGTIQYHTVPYGTIQYHTGPLTILDHTIPYGTIRDHSQLFQAYGAVSNFFVTDILTDRCDF